VNTVRRDEHKALLAQGDERLTGTRYLFLRNPWKMSRGQWAALKPLAASHLKVGRAWAIKETFMDTFACRQPARAERALKAVLAWMSRSRLAPMRRPNDPPSLRWRPERHSERHHERHRRGHQLPHPMAQETGRRLSQPGTLPPGHLLPPRRLGPLSRRGACLWPPEILKRQFVTVPSGGGDRGRRGGDLILSFALPPR
jgi:hypothetical protein